MVIRKDFGQTVIYEIKHEKKIVRGVKCITRIPAISPVCLSSYLMQFANFICKDLLHLFEVLPLHARANWVREFNYPLKNESHILGNEIWEQLSSACAHCSTWDCMLTRHVSPRVLVWVRVWLRAPHRTSQDLALSEGQSSRADYDNVLPLCC